MLKPHAMFIVAQSMYLGGDGRKGSSLKQTLWVLLVYSAHVIYNEMCG